MDGFYFLFLRRFLASSCFAVSRSYDLSSRIRDKNAESASFNGSAYFCCSASWRSRSSRSKPSRDFWKWIFNLMTFLLFWNLFNSSSFGIRKSLKWSVSICFPRRTLKISQKSRIFDILLQYKTREKYCIGHFYWSFDDYLSVSGFFMKLMNMEPNSPERREKRQVANKEFTNLQ